MKRTLFEADEKYIGDNYLRMTQQQMAEILMVAKGTVGSCMKRNGWRVPADVKEARKCAAIRLLHANKHAEYREGDDEIRAHYLDTPVKALAKKIGRSHCYLNRRLKELGLVIPPEIIERNRQVGRRKKGNVSHNKGRKQREYMSEDAIRRSADTRFKKGNVPHNTKEADGVVSIRLDKRTGIRYKYVRLALGKWELQHRVVWEQEHGKIPEGHLLVFRDGDQMNVAVENLELITMAENAMRNSPSMRLTDGFVANAIAGGKYRSDPAFKALLVEHKPELIALKRTEIQLKRTLKNRTNE